MRLASLVTVLMLISGAAWSLDPTRSIVQYGHRAWHLSDGLPQSSVVSIAQTHDGYLWVGTQEGLARFDGIRFRTFEEREGAPTLGGIIYALLCDRSGTLWIGASDGLARYENGHFTEVAPQILSGKRVWSVAQDRSGAIWAGTKNAVVRISNGAAAVKFDMPQSVYFIYAGRDSVWMGTSRGLYRHHDGRIEAINVGNDGPGEASVYAITEDRAGVLWIGTENGLWTFDGFAFKRVKQSNLMDVEVWSLLEDRHGSIWVATRKGLVRIRGSQSEFMSAKDGLSDDYVGALFEDAEGNLWIGTYTAGVDQLFDSAFLQYGAREGFNGPSWSIAEGADGTVWVGTERNGLARKEGETWRRLTTTDGLLSNDIFSVLVDHTGVVWAGTATGLMRIEKGRISTFRTAQGLPHDEISALFEDRAGRVWIGTRRGAVWFERGRIAGADRASGESTRAFAEDRHGRIWMATLNGLRVWDGSTVASTFNGIRFPREQTWFVTEDRSGEIWFSTDAALYRIHDGRLVRYTREHGFPVRLAGFIGDGDDGQMWFGVSRGAFHVSRADLDRIAAGTLQSASHVFHAVEDGLADAELVQGVQPSVCRTRDGKLWFPNTRGVGVLDPRAVGPKALPPPIIETVLVDSIPRTVSDLASNRRAMRDVVFTFTAPFFSVPKQVRFRYRLVGFDREWIDAGTTRQARYTNLSPSSYRFLLQASVPGGPWRSSVTTPAFVIPIPFYRTVWFALLCMIAAAATAWAFHSLRLRNVRARHDAVLAERRRIARELHDSLAQGLAGVSLQIESAMLHEADRARSEQHLRTAKQMAQWSLVEAERALSDLRSAELESRDLADALRAATEKLTAGVPIRYELTIAGTPRRLDAQTENHLLRIGQEAITNVVRHARAAKVDIELHFQAKSVRLIVRDDGRGSGEHNLEALAAVRNGLKGMRERAREIGGTFSFRSIPDSGTEVVVETAA